MKIAHQISDLELRLANLEKEAGIGSWVAEFFEDRPTSADLIRGKYFSKANISEVKIDNLILDGKDFRGANFHRSSMKSTKAKGASFKGAGMSWVDLSGSVFNGCDFTGVDFRFANLNNVTFNGCSLKGVKLHSLRGAVGVKILNSNIEGLTIIGGVFKSPILPPLKGASLKGASFEDCALSDVESPVSCSFYNCEINGLTGDVLSSKTNRCKVKGLNLTSAQNTLFKGLIVEGKAKINKGVSLRFSGVQFMGPSLTLNLISSVLYGVTFSKCFVSNTNIKDSKGKIVIRSCEGLVDFRNCSFPNSRIEKCKISMGVTDLDLSGSQIVNNDLRFTGASDLDVTGADLSGSEISGLIYSAEMNPSDFDQALMSLRGILDDPGTLKGYMGLVKTMHQTKAIKAEVIERMERHYDKKFTSLRPEKEEKLFVFISYLKYIDSELSLIRELSGPQPHIESIEKMNDLLEESTSNSHKKVDILLGIYQDYSVQELSDLLTERGMRNRLPSEGRSLDLIFLRVAMLALNVNERELIKYLKEVRPLFK
jgi:uncharacterized protein YjbI with pentapeptide repeats